MQPSTAVQHEDRRPFLALGGMDGRQDEVVLVEDGRPGLVAGRIRRVERQLGQEAFARRIARGDLLELQQVGLPRRRVLVDAFEMRLIPEPDALDLGRPARPPRAAARRSSRRKPASRRPPAAAAGSARAAAPVAAAGGHGPRRSRTRCADAARHPAGAACTRKPATRSRGFSAKRSTASTSLTWAASRNFKPPNFTKGMLRRVSSISSGPLWCEARNSTACSFSAAAGLAVRQHALADVARLLRLVADGDQLGPLRRRRSVQRFLVKPLGRQADHARWRRPGSAGSSGSCGRA